MVVDTPHIAPANGKRTMKDEQKVALVADKKDEDRVAVGERKRKNQDDLISPFD